MTEQLSPQSKTESVKHYFDLKAAHYFQTSGNRLWSAVKHREQAAIFQLLNPQKRECILDAGCGDGYYLHELTKLGCAAEGIDLSPKMVAEVRQRGMIAQEANLESPLPVAPERFDKILCAGVFEFCDEPRAALRNLKTAAKPGGEIILFLPKQSLSGWMYQLFHRFLGCGVRVSLFRLADVRHLAGECGLELTDVISATPFSMALKLRNGGNTTP